MALFIKCTRVLVAEFFLVEGAILNEPPFIGLFLGPRSCINKPAQSKAQIDVRVRRPNVDRKAAMLFSTLQFDTEHATLCIIDAAGWATFGDGTCNAKTGHQFRYLLVYRTVIGTHTLPLLFFDAWFR